MNVTVLESGELESTSDVRAEDATGEVIHGKKWPHLAGAAGVLALGVAAAFGALQLGYWHQGPGPGFFPLWMGILLTTLGLVWGWQVRNTTAVPAEDDAPEHGQRQIAQVLAALVVLVLVLDLIGFQLGMTLFVLFIVRVVGRRRWLDSVIVAVIAGFGVYALFANVLQVYLPTASFAFLTNVGL